MVGELTLQYALIGAGVAVVLGYVVVRLVRHRAAHANGQIQRRHDRAKQEG